MIKFLSKIILCFLFILFVGCKTKQLTKEIIIKDSVIVRDTVIKLKPENFFIYDTIREKYFTKEYITQGGVIKVIYRDSILFVKCNPERIDTIIRKVYINNSHKEKTTQLQNEKKFDYEKFFTLCFFGLMFVIFVILYFRSK